MGAKRVSEMGREWVRSVATGWRAREAWAQISHARSHTNPHVLDPTRPRVPVTMAREAFRIVGSKSEDAAAAREDATQAARMLAAHASKMVAAATAAAGAV